MKDDWIRVAQAELTEPPSAGLCQVYSDRYWAVDAEGKLLFYQRMTSPQCNLNRGIVDLWVKQPSCPAVSVVQLPRVYVPVGYRDFE